MEWLKLIGILVVVVGFVLKFDTMATVVVAGLVTGLVAGMSPMEILETLGNSFIPDGDAVRADSVRHRPVRTQRPEGQGG